MGRVRWSWHRILAAAAVISATAVVNANAASSPALPQLHAADVADAYVDALAPATNFGAAPVLRTWVSDVAYLRFEVTGLTGRTAVTLAQLRVHTGRSLLSGSGFTVHPVAAPGGWSEDTVTWRTQPGYTSTVLARQGTVTTPQWLTLSLPRGFITRNGIYELALVGRGASAVDVASRETATPPRLDLGLTAVAPRVAQPGRAATKALGIGLPIPPINLQQPSVQGQTVVWQTLTAQPGSWLSLDAPTYTFQWQRCGADGKNCVDIPGATGPSYKLRWQDIGSAFAAVVTAHNGGGSANATTAPTAAVIQGDNDPVIAAAGDIACDPASLEYNNGAGTASVCRESYTSALPLGQDIAAVLPLGDNVYWCGSLQAYQQSYAPSWGQLKDISYPAPGNHEYLTSGGTGCDASNTGAAGYFNYYGAAAGPSGRGYYSYDLGSWHLISLDSNCTPVGGCGLSSPQGKWLANDLATHPNQCTLAYWHIPLFSSGGRANANMLSIFGQLYQAGVDVVLTAHDHIYERFAPQDPSGNPDPARGIREFIAGTGGANHTSIVSLAPNSEVRDATTFGVLELTLKPTSYTWQFVPEQGGKGSFTDAGSGSCH